MPASPPEPSRSSATHARRPTRADVEEITDALLLASRALVGVAARSIARFSDDVTLPQFRALVVLAGRGPQGLGALAQELAIHTSTATRMCDRLVAKELISREVPATNRREVVLELTRPGRELVDHVLARRRTEIGAIVARIPAEARRPMVAALHAFGEAAGEPALDAGAATRWAW